MSSKCYEKRVRQVYTGKEKNWFVTRNNEIISKHYTFANAQTGVERALRKTSKEEIKLNCYNPFYTFNPNLYNFEIKHKSELTKGA